MLNKYLFITFTFIVFALQGCGSSKLAPLNNGTILAFGDSLTVGVGTSEENSYPAVLAKLTGLEVVSSGVSGETTAQGLERLPDELERVQPDLVILIEGGNDILQNKDFAETRQNLQQMIEMIRAQGIQLVFIGVPEKSLFSDSAPFYKELAEQYDLVFDASLIASLQRSPSLKSDAVHFNEEGYREMAEQIYALLQDNGAL